MRLSRTPIKAAYRPAETPPPAPPMQQFGPGDDATEAIPNGSLQPDNDDVPDYRLTSASIWPSLVIAGVGVIMVVAVGIFAVASFVELSPVALVNAILPISAQGTTIAAASAPAASTPRAAPPTSPAATSRTIRTRAFGLWRDRLPGLLDPQPDAPHPLQPSRTYPPGFDILDGATLQADDVRLRLAEIATLPANTICLSDQSAKFACGLMARASLSVMVHGEKLVCYPDVSLDTETPLSLCQAHGRDVSLAQIEAGFALPAAPSLDSLEGLVASARARHAGAWNGDWTFVLPGSGAVGPPAAPSLVQ